MKTNIDIFVALLNSPMCTFRHAIQGCLLYTWSLARLRTSIDALAANTDLTGMFMIAHNIFHEELNFTSDLQIPLKFPFIRKLVYSLTPHETISAELPQLITFLAHLETLSIYTELTNGVDTTADLQVPISNGENVLSNLRTLRIRMFDPSRITNWLLKLSGHTPHIETLDVAIFGTSSTN